MVKCPFCQYDNEEGALFCEQCKSDLGGVEPVAVAHPVEAHAIEGAPAMPVMGEAEGFPVAAMFSEAAEVVEAAPVDLGMPVQEVPMAAPLEAEPFADLAREDEAPPEAAPVAEVPFEAPPVEAAPAAPTAEGAPVEAPPAPPPPVEAPPAVVAAPPASLAPPAAAPAAPAAAAALPPDARPRLVVLRGLKINTEYPIYEGHNFIGRADEKPVDIDLEDQEPPDRIWSSRQHALITFEDGLLVIEDLNSSNGTFVNRARIYPGQKRPLNLNDVVQIGTVQMKLKA
jgi:hypothetical protein